MANHDRRTEPFSGSGHPATASARQQTEPLASAARNLQEVEPRVPIGATTTPGDSSAVFKITQPGSYYLTGDVVGENGKSGIVIAASRVVLDMKGFALVGVIDSVDGVLVNVAARDIVIRNGIVRDWEGHGLNAANATDGRYQDIVASGNRLNGVHCGERSALRSCSVQANRQHGIQAGDGSSARMCDAQQNDGYGILLGRESLVSDCLARGNGIYGINAGQGSTIWGCTGSANQLAGIVAFEGSTIVDCTASFNDGDGILPSAGSTVTNCTVSNNRSGGIRPNDGTTVANCTLRSNGAGAIQVSDRARIVGNLCDGNTGAGIRVLGSENVIEANRVTGNDRGLEIRAAANMVQDNTVHGNDDNYDIVAGNHLNILLSQIPESIDWPASVRLVGTLTGLAGSSGITVNSSDVTIDLNGHALIGVPGSLDGIKVTSATPARTNVCVRNGMLRGWGDKGLNAEAAHNSIYRDLCVSSNGATAIEHGLHCGSDSVVIQCTARDNGGNGISAGSNSVIRDCTAHDNGGDGISASASVIQGCTAYGNTDDGINGGTASTIRDCVARSNDGDGIVVSDRSCVLNNNSTDNAGAGIRLPTASQGNRIESNHVTDNLVGIVAESSSNLIIRNSADHNGDFDNDPTVQNYDIVVGNSTGPTISAGDIDTDESPHANYSL